LATSPADDVEASFAASFAVRVQCLHALKKDPFYMSVNAILLFVHRVVMWGGIDGCNSACIRIV
jgi:hypothetical protein